ncbi:MAG: hypothetical protein JSS71_13315 [Armatimonadetes bacterium]|nr:hypothetical protein [Armatimonadota bacterium]MBX3110234.1 hypothetical protein [Fimbriimonadaceae bacterium]
MKTSIHTKAAAAVLAVLAASSAQANFAQVVIDRIQDPYGKIRGMRTHDDLLSTIQPGQFRRYSRLGHWPLPRHESDYRTDELEADTVSSLAALSLPVREAVSRQLVSTYRFGAGSVEFSRANMSQGEFQGVFKVVTSSLGIRVSAGDANNLTVKLSWDDVSVQEFQPAGMRYLAQAFQQSQLDPYLPFAGLRRHESWMVTKTVSVVGLRVEITANRPQSGFDVTVAGVGGVHSNKTSEGHFIVTVVRPVVVASDARNAQRADIYAYAGLKMPKL